MLCKNNQTPNDPKPEYNYELTTAGFKVNDDGVLVVADQHLDRDPPNPAQLQFQVGEIILQFYIVQYQ